MSYRGHFLLGVPGLPTLLRDPPVSMETGGGEQRRKSYRTSVYTIPNWARSLSSMSPKASQGQTTAASAGHAALATTSALATTLALATTSALQANSGYWCVCLPPSPSIPGTSSKLQQDKLRLETGSSLRYRSIDPFLFSSCPPLSPFSLHPLPTPSRPRPPSLVLTPSVQPWEPCS